MSRIWLPIGAAIKNPQTERQAIIMRLRQLGWTVVGAEDPKIHDVSHLRDLLQKYEEKARIPEIVTPPPRYTKKQIAEALKDVKGFQDARKAGRRRLY